MRWIRVGLVEDRPLILAGYSLKEAHAYIGDAAPATIAPGQYGNTAYMEGGETTYTFTAPLVDADGVFGAWVVAHAAVCR